MAATSPASSSTWKYAAVPTLVVMLLALFPQINIWMVKGSAWNGAYVVSNYDEVAYSGYVNSLLDGRPRKNDPFIGSDNVETESLYSIQLVPAYVIGLTARVFGLDASAAFILLNVLIPLCASLAIFFLIGSVTGDGLWAAVGTVCVLLLGTAVVFQGQLHYLIWGNSFICEFFPFLRRYQPGFAFPIFFVFGLLVWRMLSGRLAYAAVAGVTIVVLIFSYFFLWAAALAWLGCITVLWFVARPDERRGTILRVGIVWAFALAALIPYFLLLANRPHNLDETQLLAATRMPNLLAIPEVIGFLIIVAIIVLVRKGRLAFSEPPVIFALSLAATPFVLFNQQVITGRSLQPVHYELFIANYLILLALVLLGWLIVSSKSQDAPSPISRKVLVYVGLATVMWGVVESTSTASRNAGYESLRDDSMPVLRYLDEQAGTSPATGGTYPTVISTNLMLADFVPTMTSYRSLWTPHTNSAGGVNAAENKELFYRYLYYSGFDEKDVAQAFSENLFELKAAIFGGGRALSELEKNAKPIERAEIEAEIRNYSTFRRSFTREHATSPQLSYVIVPSLAEPNFQKLDQWYTRDEGRVFGLFKIYKLDLKL